MFSNFGVPELLIIAGVIILLFGAKKLPEMARSLGKSAKAFKEETKNLRDEDDDKDKSDKPADPPAQLPEAKSNGQPVAESVKSESVKDTTENKNAS
ncbi:sec-independent protein translocase protein TatA [Herbihabitans rhizosphaerae]|uniref:Sec-independent protein translocase protein TatA n=1 Tax=Herbihabitans rhizosphaerae TaxID=1872711 RepID=A0A4Q7L3G4_9PSEU|nr:Sec-independent protein translocase subunit TatA [Herbihabitans rhizosphaerae]RZS43777.1 sec-independent protein translocase protein TatA [Herbihabitans rhizosphaerae]